MSTQFITGKLIYHIVYKINSSPFYYTDSSKLARLVFDVEFTIKSFDMHSDFTNFISIDNASRNIPP